MGWLLVPLDVASSEPYQFPPSWNKIVDPGAKVVSSTGVSDSQALFGDKPLLLSLPVELT